MSESKDGHTHRRLPPAPANGPSRAARLAGLGLLLLSMVALGTAPRLMPSGYSWLRHTTSESAAQGVPGAWLARLGFLSLGFAVLWMSVHLRGAWPPPVRWMFAAFGVLMVSTAAFSIRPWWPEAAFDPVEDALHSVTATALGFAFAFGAALRFLHRGGDATGRVLDILAVSAAIAIPLAMTAFPEWDGMLQRGMFAIAYLWFALELVRIKG